MTQADAPDGPVTAFLGLGSNVGDRLETVHSAVYAIDDVAGVAVDEVSGVYETAAWGPVDQDPYLNAVVRVLTRREPLELLRECQAIEAVYGRDRSGEQRWGPRPLDIDVLLYGEEEIDRSELVVPHPRLDERPFVLVPLLEVFPGGSLPDGRRLTRLLADHAPVEGIELVVRLQEVPTHHLTRPEGPRGPGAVAASDWDPPRGAPPGTER